MTVVLASSRATSIGFDGAQYPLKNNSPVILSVKPGIHHLEVPSLIQIRVGERHVFVGWSDGVNSSPRQIMIYSDVNIVAQYRTEYYLSVKSALGQASGSGWYPEDSDAELCRCSDVTRFDLVRFVD